MRIDRLLCYLRFVKTRSRAQQLVESGHIRCSGARVTRVCHEIARGDVLTIPLGNDVRIAEILTLPDRRGPPSEAQACYRLLDPHGEAAIARCETRY